LRLAHRRRLPQQVLTLAGAEGPPRRPVLLGRLVRATGGLEQVTADGVRPVMTGQPRVGRRPLQGVQGGRRR
jgi:hypothetical protein